MKIIIEFDGIDEQDDARTSLDGWKWKLAMWEFDQLLRSTTKHGVSLLKHDEQATSIEYEIAEKLMEEIRTILEEHNLNFF